MARELPLWSAVIIALRMLKEAPAGQDLGGDEGQVGTFHALIIAYRALVVCQNFARKINLM